MSVAVQLGTHKTDQTVQRNFEDLFTTAFGQGKTPVDEPEADPVGREGGNKSRNLSMCQRDLYACPADWGLTLFVLKLDLENAFDTVVQRQIGNSFAGRLQLIRSDLMQISTDSGMLRVPQSNGLRQGSPDSPVLFAGLVADRLQDTVRGETVLPLPTSGGLYMDDTYLWALTKEHLRDTVKRVEQDLLQDGLLFNGGKTQCVCSQSGHGTIMVSGRTVTIQGPDTSMKVLGAHFSMGGSVPMIIAHVQQKARAAWLPNKHIFKAQESRRRQPQSD